jgi:hypothetical protein
MYRVDVFEGTVEIYNSFKDQWQTHESPQDQLWFSIDNGNRCVSNSGPADLIKSLAAANAKYEVKDDAGPDGRPVYTFIRTDADPKGFIFHRRILRCASFAIANESAKVREMQDLLRYR